MRQARAKSWSKAKAGIAANLRIIVGLSERMQRHCLVLVLWGAAESQ